LTLFYLDAEEISINWLSNGFQLGKTTFQAFNSNDGSYIGEDASGYQFLLDFKGPRQFETISFMEVLADRITEEEIRDKIVLIGVMSESVKDYFDTPIQNNLFGTELLAHTVDQLIRGAVRGSKPIFVWADWQEGGWILLWSFLGGFLGLSVRSPLNFSQLIVAGLLSLVLITFLAFREGLWIPIVPPSMVLFSSAAMGTSYVSYREKNERTTLMHLFSRHVSRDVAETIWNKRDQLLEGGRLRPMTVTATVLFTDLKGFTSVSEGMDPRSLMDWLNEYMETMSGLVINHDGVVNKYIGDSIMAVFGVPFRRRTEEEFQQDARNAVSCALAMRRGLDRLNSLWESKELPTVGMRVGIHTGPLVAGSLGSTERLEYTVIGDTVNITSRLESFDKDLMDADIAGSGCCILIGQPIFELLGKEFKTRLVGRMSFKGKQEKVIIYGVIDRIEEGR